MFPDSARDAPNPDKRRSFVGKKTILVIAAALVAGLMIIFSAWFFVFRDTGPIPQQYRKGLDFTLYYPTKLPDGYEVDKGSFKREGKVLIFSINAPKGKNIAVSQQAAPADIPAHKPSPAPIDIPGEIIFTVAAGSAQVSLWGDKYVADVITNDSWIIMNLTGFTEDEAVSVTKALSLAYPTQ